GHGRGGGDGVIADVVHRAAETREIAVVRGLDELAEPHLGRGARACTTGEVDGRERSTRGVEQRCDSPATRTALRRAHGALDERERDGGIGRTPPGVEDAAPFLGGEGMAGGDGERRGGHDVYCRQRTANRRSAWRESGCVTRRVQ